MGQCPRKDCNTVALSSVHCARLDRAQLWVPSRVPPSLGTQNPAPACWTLEPGSQRQRGSQTATGLQSVLKGAFHSLSDRVRKGSRGRRLERARDKLGLCGLMRHPALVRSCVQEARRNEKVRGLQMGVAVIVFPGKSPGFMSTV